MLILIALVLVYAFVAFGAFAVEVRQRARGKPRVLLDPHEVRTPTVSEATIQLRA